MRHIIYSAVLWYVHVITAILWSIRLLCFGRAIVKCYQFHTTKRKLTPQYVTNPAFGATEEEEQEEVCQILGNVPNQHLNRTDHLHIVVSTYTHQTFNLDLSVLELSVHNY